MPEKDAPRSVYELHDSWDNGFFSDTRTEPAERDPRNLSTPWSNVPAPSFEPTRGRVTRVPLDRLLDAESPRLGGLDERHLSTLLDVEDDLPPIIVHGPTMRVIDGMHRLHAARLRNRETIDVVYFDGSEKESFVLAVEANVRHGLPLTLAERKESAKRILRSYPEWSNQAIATKTGLSSKTVGMLRRDDGAAETQPTVRIGRDGRVRPLSVVEGRLRAREVLAQNPDASLREIARESGISVGTARDVRERLSKGESPIPGSRAAAAEAEPRPAEPGPSSELVDFAIVLDSLRKDPALRYSDEGRALIRWLETRTVRREEINLVAQVPAHQATRLANMARACAAHWEAIAVALERRGG
ncbi:ParB N-terminal domain-containing protein [Streptacidiphilus sp. PB12-B1b]|uniref:ParB/RepB/Spo0J family partition protein n=1 Tax=Streptacidiphilus sp. PB12-B1b TaxID=2705012 RepID=UPI0015FC545F|nr:ParB N-terminal domain-containing protein [Streptacidiphilus sp. PB12-B1b]QMU78265.1 ParB N-terminal domain-containing protein [Streptacidiphilus sp. PB12-B1b]